MVLKGLERPATIRATLFSAASSFVMAQVERIQAEIEALSQEDFARLREWIAEKDWQLWDEQLEADVAEGKLDFLMEESMTAKAKGQLQEL
ncbi:MAG: hypothetical protein AAFY57_15080 [Cyanobacteria bacterium J06642_2]